MSVISPGGALPNIKSDQDGRPAVSAPLVQTFAPAPPPVSSHLMWRQLDVFGHHRAACAEAGVLGRRGYPFECAAAQVCMEAGGRVATNVHVRDMGLAVFDALDGRRLEVVADGLTLWHETQLAIDTILVSPVATRWDRQEEGREPRRGGTKRGKTPNPTDGP